MKTVDNWHLIDLKIAETKKAYEELSNRINQGLILFGAGQCGAASIEFLQGKGFSVTGVIDNSPSKIGKKIHGVPIIGKNDELVKRAEIILLTVKHAVKDIAKAIPEGTSYISFDTWFLHEYYSEYKFLYENFSDSDSKKCLVAILLTMLTGDENYCANVAEGNQYFALPQFINNGAEYFVDAGAYVGDTVEKFIWAQNGAFKKIYAFEPGPMQWIALNERLCRLTKEWALDASKINLMNTGLGSERSFASININDDHLLGANLTTKTEKNDQFDITVQSLDDILNGDPVTFLKADIEGMEMEMLRGAKISIATHKPKMALSVYHKPDDLINIASFVKQIDPNYKMALRQHSPLLMDTTLYCWLEK
jgi:FkbM family methyltransferase